MSYYEIHSDQKTNAGIDSSSKSIAFRWISERITKGTVMMDGEISWAANYEVKKKWAGKPIYSQVKTVRRGRRREKAVK